MEELKPSAANSPPLGFLERAATVYGDCTSIIYGNSTVYTWRETNLRCLRVASSLSSIGIKRSDVVSVLSANTPAMYELQFAVPMSGAILNNINTRLDATTVSVLLRHCESKLLFVDVFYSDLAVEAIKKLYKPPILVLIEEDEEGGDGADVADRSKFCYSYSVLVERRDPGFNWIRPESEWDPIVVNYTSGTTSSPKGVVHCHRGIFVMSLDSLIDWAVPMNPVYLWTLPIFHANGWCYPWAIAAVGGTNVCLRKFQAPLIHHLIRDHGVTHMCGAPVVLNMLTATHEEPLKSPVEAVLYTHPAVNEAAVVARPDEHWGETPCAFVSLKPGLTRKPTEKELIEYCREKMPRYMVPKTVVFLDELPKTSTGKIHKFVLKEMANKMGSTRLSRL
ncbi:hypothetical protein IGI04_006464 [Brassica rapa subsp. trilocularis]|uniref:AMP-dependent synthetase/ligase domain-containing protein n=1 Tax=Brassica rapa subsp. trilocularis TaxID=1813537 RepID=A0ABQ7NH04_BRACM|nr:hypothetical protein IGI04_006464 [Brassica rapa subsp. trilocularis]